MSKLRVDKIAAPIVEDKFTGSVFFDGNGDHLDVPLSDDFQFGAEDFTIEAWVYILTAKDAGIFGTNKSSGSFAGYELDVFTNGSVRFYSGNGSAYNYSSLGAESAAGVVPLRTWTHIAASRQDNTLRLFVNGVLSVSNTSFSHTIATSPTAPDIGNDGISTGSTYHTHGYISNLRVCKGHAVYTGNFTVPTRELEVHTKPPKGVVFPAADNKTVLLACQSATDATLDSSGRHTITAAGDAHAQSANPGLLSNTNITSTVTENTGSVYFDGTDDSLNIAANADFAYGTGDFTWEFWFKTDAGFVEGDGGYLIDHAPAGSDGNDGAVWVGSNTLYYHSAPLGGVTNLSFGGVSNETWYHVAVARESGTTRLFLNGVLANSASDSANYTTNNTRFRIGDYIGTGYAFKGYISNLRICKGHAVYTETFTPPTRELEVHQGPDDDRTVLLACYDGENIFADKSGRHIISSIGDRTSSPTPIATDSPIGITTENPGITRNVDPTAGPTFQGGAGYTSQNWLTLPKGTTTERNQTGGRGLIMGGYTTVPSAAAINTIEFITISSLGNAQVFGDLTSTRFGGGGCGSSTRGLYGGGEPSKTPIDYATIASTGNSVSFGSLDSGSGYVKACSNQTRGIWGGGRNPNSASINVVQYVTIATLGNSQDFGILTSSRTGLAALSSPTRGIFSGGYTHPSPTTIATLDYITIAATGNALDFGDLLTNVKYSDAVSSGTRGAIGGGGNPNTNVIQYVTISTLGNAQDFGDLITTREHISGTDNSIRGVFMGGITPTSINNLDFVTIASTGNAADFGDLSQTIGYAGGTSDSHGGLS